MNNVTPITAAMTSEPATKTPPTLSIDQVLQELELWRATRDQHHQVSFPDDLWHKIFALATTHSAIKIRALFGISAQQYNRKFEQFYPPTDPPAEKEVTPSNVDFCEIKPNTTPYQPLKIPSHTTIVVEFYRPDGYLMKIHTTTENFKDLMQAFFAGDFHATTHTPS